MSNWDSYKREESERKPLGKRRCVIIGAEETTSKASGKPMIVVTVQPSGSEAKIKNYIVKNEYFNKNMTNLFDAFPQIGEGNFEFPLWIGCEGAANFELDENGYNKVKWWISAESAKNLPEFVGQKPEKQEYTELPSEDGSDELPF